MSMTTSLRFEVASTSNPLAKALEREHQRIIKDERLAEQNLNIKRDHEESLKSDWIENLEAASLKMKYKLNQTEMKHELQHGGKMLTMKRRALLRDLFEKDHLDHEQELHKSGKAFYVKRI